MTGIRHAGSVTLCALILFFTAAPACAQLSGAVAWFSDYRYRGVDLSAGRPVAQAGLDYDADSGWFAGALLSGVELDDQRGQQVELLGGFGAQVKPGLAWDAGVISQHFVGISDYNYNELYAGVTTDHLNARIDYSPRYFYQSSPAWYAEMNAAYPLSDRLQWLAHAGVLVLTAVGDNPFAPSSRADYRVGMNWTDGRCSVQLAWVGLQKKATPYPYYEDLHPRVVQLSLRLAL